MPVGNKFGNPRSTAIRIFAALLIAAPVFFLARGDEAKSPSPPRSNTEEKEAIAESQRRVFTHLLEKSGKKATGTGRPTKEPSVWCWEHYKANEKYQRRLYFLILDDLLVAKKTFLGSAREEVRRKGLGMALEACRCAHRRLKDKELALLICEAFLEPYVEDADNRPWNYVSKQNLLEVMASVYADARNAKKLVATYQAMIGSAADQNTADGARLRLAQVLDKTGEYDQAILILNQIDENAGVGGGKRLIPTLEAKAKEKRRKEGQK